MIRRSTWIVLIVLVVLVGLVIYLQNKPQTDNAQTLVATEGYRILDLDVNNIVGLRVIGSDGKIFYATRQAPEEWTLVQPGISGELDGVKLESYLNQLLSLQPLSRVESGISPQAIGLLNPEYTIRITLNDGQERLLEVGKETPTKSGVYMKVENTDVVAVPMYSIQSILDLLQELPLVPTPTPEFTPTTGIPVDEGNSEVVTPTP